jgi:hypothetical protein
MEQESNGGVVNSATNGENEMAGKKKDNATTEAVDHVKRATKMVNRALTSVFRIGTLKELKTPQIDKIEAALTKNLNAAIAKLRNPEPEKETGFSL